MTLLSRQGLRSGEVAALRLVDIDVPSDGTTGGRR
jgi:integrase